MHVLQRDAVQHFLYPLGVAVCHLLKRRPSCRHTPGRRGNELRGAVHGRRSAARLFVQVRHPIAIGIRIRTIGVEHVVLRYDRHDSRAGPDMPMVSKPHIGLQRRRLQRYLLFIFIRKPYWTRGQFNCARCRTQPVARLKRRTAAGGRCRQYQTRVGQRRNTSVDNAAHKLSTRSIQPSARHEYKTVVAVNTAQITIRRVNGRHECVGIRRPCRRGPPDYQHVPRGYAPPLRKLHQRVRGSARLPPISICVKPYSNHVTIVVWVYVFSRGVVYLYGHARIGRTGGRPVVYRVEPVEVLISVQQPIAVCIRIVRIQRASVYRRSILEFERV